MVLHRTIYRMMVNITSENPSGTSYSLNITQIQNRQDDVTIDISPKSQSDRTSGSEMQAICRIKCMDLYDKCYAAKFRSRSEQ